MRDEQGAIIAIDVKGNVLRLEDEATDALAGVALDLRQHENQLKAWRQLVEAELMDRLTAEEVNVQVVGAYELRMSQTGTGKWDPDDLSGALDDLIVRGILSPQEKADVVHAGLIVDGNKARKLVNRLARRLKDEILEACYTKPRGGLKLEITPVPDLADALRDVQTDQLRRGDGP